MESEIQKMHAAINAIEAKSELRLRELSQNALDFTADFNRQVVNKNLGEDFNPLSALTRHHLEELHSRQLFYLLNPKSNHGCGAVFLEAFVDLMTAQNPEIWSAGKPALDELEKAKVYREHHIGWSYETDDYGKIDLFIETDHYLIAIENKIHANEQERQLERYYNYCKKQVGNSSKKIVVLYLTINGEDSKEAFGEYTAISYREHITQWLISLIETLGANTKIGIGLHFYLDLLYTHILKTKSFAMITKMKDFLLAEENRNLLRDLSAEDLRGLADAVVETRNSLRTLFFEKVFFALKERGILLKPVHQLSNPISITEIWPSEQSGFRLENEEWMVTMVNGNKAVFCIEHGYGKLWFGLFLFRLEDDLHPILLLKDHYETVTSLINELQRKVNFTLEAPEDGWITFRYFNTGSRQFNFVSDKLNYELATNMDDLVTKFIEEVMVFLDALKIVAAESKP